MKYSDPDGRMAYSVQYGENMYGFTADATTSGDVLRKLYSFIPFFGDKIFKTFINRYVGYTPIENSGVQNLYSDILNKASFALDALGNIDEIADYFKIAGDVGDAVKTIGSTVSTLSNIAIVGDIALTLKQSNSIAFDSTINALFGDVILGKSHDDVSSIYYYATNRVNQLLESGEIKASKQKISGRVNYIEYNKESVNKLRTELYILSRTLMEIQE